MKNSISIFIILILSLSTCKKVDQWTQFEMEYDEMVIIPSSTGINLPFNLLSPEFKTNSESTFTVNDTHKDLVEEILLTKLDLTLSSPSNGDFGFLKSINVFLSADGLTEIKIAWKENIPSNVGQYIELETSDIDFKEYIKKDEFSLRLYTVTDEVLTSDHHIDVHSVFFVDAKILGQ